LPKSVGQVGQTPIRAAYYNDVAINLGRAEVGQLGRAKVG